VESTLAPGDEARTSLLLREHHHSARAHRIVGREQSKKLVHRGSFGTVHGSVMEHEADASAPLEYPSQQLAELVRVQPHAFAVREPIDLDRKLDQPVYR
jgi:hypothetical protein